ncbi:MAG: hypothetical protein ABIP28_10840 [Mucilaginibacter sp.]
MFIDWFSGDLGFPVTNKLLRWDGVFNTIYEEEIVLHIANGNISNIDNVNNYVDDLKATDRRYNTKVSDILLKHLKKLKIQMIVIAPRSIL